jgi:hypothetical protein
MTFLAKPRVIIKSPKRFLVHKGNLELRQKIFDTCVEWTTERLIDEVFLSLMSVGKRTQRELLDGNTKSKPDTRCI